jgi:two-component system, NarL family, sensor histidine kinase DesK
VTDGLGTQSRAGVTGAPGGAYGPGEWPEVPLKRSERFSVLTTACVWLVFLVWPLVAMVTGDAPWGQKILGYTGLAAFVAVYVGHFIWPWPFRQLPHWANTAAATLVLGLCILAVVPAAGLNAFNFLAFTLAIWIFPHRVRVGIPVAFGLALVWVGAALVAGAGSGQWWLVIPTTLALVIMISLRLAMDREENARVLGEELALSRQREQFGRDVHDVLGHSLTVITLKTELARRLVDADPQRARAELDEILVLSRESLTEVRNTVGGLHAPDLGAQIAAARTALDAAGMAARLPPWSAVSGLPAERRDLFAWCLREAVTNVVRHSGASTCTVALAADRLTVSDDGVGLPEAGYPGMAGTDGPAAGPTSAAPRGHGLRGMRQRVAEAGGTLALREAHPGRDRPGTILEVQW